jgi:hypothetical protein
MNESPLHPLLVGDGIIRVDLRSEFDLLENFSLQRFPFNIRQQPSHALPSGPGPEEAESEEPERQFQLFA